MSVLKFGPQEFLKERALRIAAIALRKAEDDKKAVDDAKDKQAVDDAKDKQTVDDAKDMTETLKEIQQIDCIKATCSALAQVETSSRSQITHLLRFCPSDESSYFPR